ncbi:hypothetical protein KBD11_01300 [Candidatus Saccharibacteria bacterium]|nr:hypothetical protein [Candidatus Saccharibacteria bacterium]
MKPTRIAVLASGSGSTAEAFIRTVHQQNYPLHVVLVIANNPDAFVLERVKNLNNEYSLHISSAVINSRTQQNAAPIVPGQQTDEEQAAILKLLDDHGVDLVLLLGYMKRVGPKLLAAFGWMPNYTSIYQCRMLNTHPGLLPDTVGTHGRDTQAFTLAQNMKEGGQSLHAVSDEYDTGPTVAEHRVPVEPGDSADTLFDRVQAVEKSHIAADVAAFVQAQQHYQKEAHKWQLS